MADNPLIIGGASGFWGEAPHATEQLLNHDGLDFLVYDYLAEITMSIMARARLKDPALGYATDFISDAMAGNIKRIAARGIRILSNAGGVNPRACAQALQHVLDKAGLSLSVAVVEGDDFLERAATFIGVREMFSKTTFPDADKIASINAYLGALPVAAALDAGADIVITGRCADSALALAACIHHFKWKPTEYDLLAAGSLAGHLLECGPQSTGGNFTDWEMANDLVDIGYPIAEVLKDGRIVITKPAKSTGIVSPASVGEQLLYEIGDPKAYMLPDVICDFSHVSIRQEPGDRVLVAGARGRAPSGQLKVSATFMDGYRAGHVLHFNGRDARIKARTFVEAGLQRASGRLSAMGAPGFDEVCIETFGGSPPGKSEEEITIKAAVRHADSRAVGLFLKEVIGGALATPPGLHFFTGGGRPRPSPVVRLFSFLIDAADVPQRINVNGTDIGYVSMAPAVTVDQLPPPLYPPHRSSDTGKSVTCRLEDIAWARSGDKGNDANIGVIARHEALLPWIWQALDETTIKETFAPGLKGSVERFYLPGLHAMNILMHSVLGGGGIASLLNDAQGKTFAQQLLALPVTVPEVLIDKTRGETA